MASEQRLYTFSSETKDALTKFRLSSSRSKDPQAIIYTINRSTLEIAPQNPAAAPLTSLLDIADALPDNTPRFVLLSYPLTLASGRAAQPYVLLAYMPPTASAEMRMLYAGARELLRAQSSAGQVVDVADAESELGEGNSWLEKKLGA